MPASERLQHLVKRFEENAGCEIDALVYELYGLTEEEVGIVSEL